MRRVAFWATVVGVSLISPYVLGVLARRFPSSPAATLNTDLKRT
jgi:hypothetical protein